MTPTTSPGAPPGPVDTARQEAFAGRMVEILNGAGLALMTSLGHRTGLFDAMARQPAATSAELAARADLDERYVREWLGAMVTGGIVELAHDGGLRYTLPAEHAAHLTRAGAPENMAASAQFIGLLGSVEDDIARCFQQGGGVPYERFGRFHEIMQEESEQSVVHGLVDQVLPLAPELVERLEEGITVADVGCGSGSAMVTLGRAFPRSCFTGYDLSAEAVERANRQGRSAGLDNVGFVQHDAGRPMPGGYDLVTAFDAVHDQADPAAMLANIHAMLRPGGVFLMQDISGHSHVGDNREHLLGPFLYTISCMHCMTVSLAQGGAGLGAMWGRELAESMLAEAGFVHTAVHELDSDPMNFWYVSRRDP